MQVYDYAEAASTINIDDITSNWGNRDVLRLLKRNSKNFTTLWVRDTWGDGDEYCPDSARDSGWLGYFIGKNTKLRELVINNPFEQGALSIDVEPFCRGVNSNRSIQCIKFDHMDLSGGEIFQSLRPFFENNRNLSEIEVEHCTVGIGCAEQLSSVLMVCSKSLKSSFKLDSNEMGREAGIDASMYSLGERLMDVITALGTHSQLEKLDLVSANIGRNECTALANLFRSTATELRRLDLSKNAIDDKGVDALVGALANSGLLYLNLTRNDITVRGCESLTALLKNPNCNLDTLDLYNNSIGSEGAHIFANALTSNGKLKELNLCMNGIIADGYSSFSKILCDTSSVNATFLSNHTLEGLGGAPSIPLDIKFSLRLNNSSEDKKKVAMNKILNHHQHFDMQPFFEWDLKVLPLAVAWFEKTRYVGDNNDAAGIRKRKLEAIYQFIRAMPEVFEPPPAAAGEKRKRSAVGGISVELRVAKEETRTTAKIDWLLPDTIATKR